MEIFKEFLNTKAKEKCFDDCFQAIVVYTKYVLKYEDGYKSA